MEADGMYKNPYDALADKLELWEAHNGKMPGIIDPKCRKAFIEQIISSLRRIEYISLIQQRSIDPERGNPHSPLYDPLRSAVLCVRDNNIDEAVWTVFIATQFGRHKSDGWKLASNVYGSFGEGPFWTSAFYKNNKDTFEEMLEKNAEKLKDKYISGRYSNHRQYQSKNPQTIAATFRTFSDWQYFDGTFTQKIRKIHQVRGQNPEEVFDDLYRSIKSVYGFGRLGAFDFLTMIGKLQIASILPRSVYLIGATGPLEGAKLLFLGDGSAKCKVRELEKKIDLMDDFLKIGKQAIEDSLCNWQKSPSKYVYFGG